MKLWAYMHMGEGADLTRAVIKARNVAACLSAVVGRPDYDEHDVIVVQVDAEHIDDARPIFTRVRDEVGALEYEPVTDI
jgi:hypothetical protein